MKSIILNIWLWLDGNKTILCAIILYLLAKGLLPVSPEWSDAIQYIFIAFGLASAGDHYRKGRFSTRRLVTLPKDIPEVTPIVQ